MKKLIIGISLAVAVTLFGFIFLYKPCKEPSPVMVQVAMLNCLLGANGQEIRDAACKELKGASSCQFEESDLPAIRDFLTRYQIKCASDALASKNYCTDKISEIVKGNE